MLWVIPLLLAFAAGHLEPRQTATIPDFVTKYAPLIYLDQNELYLPSDIGAQLNHTYPAINFTNITTAPSPLTLSNLDQLNSLANCSSFSNCPLYLTSKDDVTTNPPWLYGVLPDPVTGETKGAKSCAVIVTDHGNGIVDAFYMYFYAYNFGLNVSNQILGDHVGDWEHNMIRFTNGTPTSMWYSQHDSGETFLFSALSKNGSRPITYSAIGSHANFAVPGIHVRTIALLPINDYTSSGAIWDPVLSAYFFAYLPQSGTFVPADQTTPVAWLSYFGAWGDKQYPDSDPRQVNFLHADVSWEFVDGPTGPADKELDRDGTCPGPQSGCTTLTALPAISGSSIPVTVTRSAPMVTASISLTTTAAEGSSKTSSGSAGSASPTSGAVAVVTSQLYLYLLSLVLSICATYI